MIIELEVFSCVLITLHKLEFLHLVNDGSTASHSIRDDDEELQQALQKYVGKN
jgi:hypothetical protein